MEENVAAARLLLARLGVTPEQLLSGTLSARAVPSFQDYVADVSAAAPDGTRRAYETYWRRIVEAWGERRLDEITPLEINRLAEQTKDRLTLRRNARDGRSATEHLIAALRCLYRHAVEDGLISSSANPALRVAKPRRLASTRHALSVDRLAEIVSAATSTGNDPDLDGLILRLHIETACRRGGALALRPPDLDRAQCLVRLREKGGTVRWQPVSPTTRGNDPQPWRCRCCATAAATRSPRAATTTCGSVSDARCRGCTPSRCPRTGYVTPR